MSKFEDIKIIDLDERRTHPDLLDKDKMNCSFNLSDAAPMEWTKIFLFEYAQACESKWAINFPRNSNPTERQMMVLQSMDNITIKAKERDVKYLLKVVEKVIQRTNEKYRQHLRDEARSKEKVSRMRDQLFGKKRGLGKQYVRQNGASIFPTQTKPQQRRGVQVVRCYLLRPKMLLGVWASSSF